MIYMLSVQLESTNYEQSQIFMMTLWFRFSSRIFFKTPWFFIIEQHGLREHQGQVQPQHLQLINVVLPWWKMWWPTIRGDFQQNPMWKMYENVTVVLISNWRWISIARAMLSPLQSDIILCHSYPLDVQTHVVSNEWVERTYILSSYILLVNLYFTQ